MSPIHYACDRGNIDILNIILEQMNKNSNMRHIIDMQDKDGSTPLMYAVICEQEV
jgi:ankyrin repeat protein